MRAFAIAVSSVSRCFDNFFPAHTDDVCDHTISLRFGPCIANVEDRKSPAIFS